MKTLLLNALALTILASTAQAALYTLSDLGSSATFDSELGMVDWSVDGKDYLKGQWFWYRIGNEGGEQSIGTLPDKLIRTFDNNFNPGLETVLLRYADGQQGLQIDVTFVLAGTDSGIRSDIVETVTIKNTGGGPMDLHFFQYTDLDLGEADSVAFPDLHSVRQAAATGIEASETVITPVADHRELNLVPMTLDSLTDQVPTTLNDQTTPMTGNVSWAYEWDVTIPAGGSFQISKDKQITPEPTTVGFLALGGLALIRRRRA